MLVLVHTVHYSTLLTRETQQDRSLVFNEGTEQKEIRLRPCAYSPTMKSTDTSAAATALTEELSTAAREIVKASHRLQKEFALVQQQNSVLECNDKG